MAGLLTSTPLTNEERKANDKHRALPIFAVLGFLFVFAYLFSNLSDALNIPSPLDLAKSTGIEIDTVFDRDGNLRSNLEITFTEEHGDTERLFLFLYIAAAFLTVYFLPVRYKQPSLAMWSIVAIMVLYGTQPTAGLILAHLVLYLILHPPASKDTPLACLPGVMAAAAFVPDGTPIPLQMALATSLGFASFVSYRYGLFWLLQIPRVASVLRSVFVQSAILTVGITALVEGATGSTWSLPLGLLLFFWQWERLIMYHVDYKDGLIPRDLPLGKYFPIFFSPGLLPNWLAGVTIGQGYHYLQSNFLCEDKNRIAMTGVKIWGFALLYLVFADWVSVKVAVLFTEWDIPVHGLSTSLMVRHFAEGGDVTTATVLWTTFLDQFRFFVVWAGILHFKVGIWRVCGYRMDPYYNRPWLSTNLMTLWSRYAFHQREFLVRAFYYPVLFRFFKKHTRLRIFAATMAAAGFGNLVWAHMVEGLYLEGLEFENLTHVLRTWPYFVLLGLGISINVIYSVGRKNRRKPWTWGPGIFLDILCVYVTLQFFCLIHVFARPSVDSSLWDHTRLFLVGLGIHID